ncbi:MAG: hypothetical protein HFH46_02480 [Bacilli bacterium]|nr:hypothetical protein [Bacilli bacterium]
MESLLYSLRPEVIISLGVSSISLGSTTNSSTLNPYASRDDINSTLVTGLSSAAMGTIFTSPGISYVQDFHQAEVYIQSLSKEELEELSEKLSLINDEEVEVENNEELMEYVRTLTLGEFKDSYVEIEEKVKSRTWG